MRTPCFLALILVASMNASATTVVVLGNRTACTSGPNAAILVTQGGKRISLAHIDVYREIENGETAVWRGTTDDNGQVKTPKLESGEYRVFVDSGKDSGTIALSVSNNAMISSVCELKFAPPPKSPVEILSEIAGDAPRISLKQFRGIVQDESNAVIPRLKISVFRKGAFDKSIAEIQSADMGSSAVGQFQLQLEHGEYVAFFDQLGFRRRAIAFNIGNAGWSGFKLTMIVSGSSTANPAPVPWKSGN